MPTFDTPEPISVTLELGVGTIRIAASDRTDTIVAVRPSDGSKKSDLTAAEQTHVEYAGGTLVIKAPKWWRQFPFRGGRESVDVQIELPSGSHVRGEAGVAGLHCIGCLGECRFETGIGGIHFERGGPVRLKTGAGDIDLDLAAGDAGVTTGSGVIRVGAIDGAATIKNGNGETWVGEARGDLRLHAANGKIRIDQTHARVEAKTANGDIYIGMVVRGSILAKTAYGKVDIGICDGAAVWLDLDTRFGAVHNDLEAAAPPGSGEDAVQVRARTAFGDISIRRCFLNRTRI